MINKFINICAVLFPFIYILINAKFPLVLKDDIYDFIPYEFAFYHGRIVFELISYFFIVWLPLKIGIPIHNFAIFSQVILKAIYFCILTYMISYSFNKFKLKPIIFTFSLVVTPIILYTILIKIKFLWSFNISQFFTGYIASIIFYLLFWYKLSDIYVKQKEFSKKDYFLLLFFALLTAMSNEELTVAAIVLLALLSFKKNLFPTLIFMTSCFFITLFIGGGTQGMWHQFNLNICMPDITTIKHFILAIYKNIILNNLVFILTLILYLFLIFKNNKDDKAAKFVICSLTGFCVFIISTIFLPANSHLTDDIPKFWFLHKGLLATFNICLYFFVLYLAGYAFDTFQNKEMKKYIILILLLCTSIQIFKDFQPRETIYSFRYCKTVQYVLDKVSIHYFRNNETAILPNDLPFEILASATRKELREEPDVFNKIYFDDTSHYLIYLEKQYGIDTSKGMTFKNNKEAMADFYSSGGKLTKKELNELDFSKIKE